MRNDDAEFVAAQPSDHATGKDAFRRLDQVHQGQVTELVPERVVELLEMIDIDQQQSRLAPVAHGAQAIAQRFEKVAPGHRPGHGVPGQEMMFFCFRRFRRAQAMDDAAAHVHQCQQGKAGGQARDGEGAARGQVARDVESAECGGADAQQKQGLDAAIDPAAMVLDRRQYAHPTAPAMQAHG